jgi:hypothetical protein
MSLLLGLMLIAPGGLGQLLFFCSMTGELGAQCCCEHEAELTLSDQPTASSGPCCEAVSNDTLVPPSRVDSVVPELASPSFVLAKTVAPASVYRLATRRTVAPYTARGPPPDTGTPLYILYSSFLI